MPTTKKLTPEQIAQAMTNDQIIAELQKPSTLNVYKLEASKRLKDFVNTTAQPVIPAVTTTKTTVSQPQPIPNVSTNLTDKQIADDLVNPQSSAAEIQRLGGVRLMLLKQQVESMIVYTTEPLPPLTPLVDNTKKL
jgi:hypothetical protein